MISPHNPFHSQAWIVGEPDIGEGTWIGPFCLIDGSGGLTIGRGCDIAAGTQIYTHSTVQRCVTDRSIDTVRRSVAIGNYTFIGAHSVVMMGVTIGNHCVVGAGAVVAIDVPDGHCAMGVPARIVGTVDPHTGEVIFSDNI